MFDPEDDILPESEWRKCRACREPIEDDDGEKLPYCQDCWDDMFDIGDGRDDDLSR